MSSWGSGYVTDIEYTEGFYPGQTPAYMSLAATLAGFEAPPFDGHFTYCELGCGRGRTSLVLAAVNPEAVFHAIDFNPSHIARAREEASRARLGNIAFHELGFEELTGPRGAELPMFDVVTMHGVWTWIAPELQQAIVAFLNARLRPGGLAYLSYNALPGCLQVAPLQRLLWELAAVLPQRSDLVVPRALEQIQRFSKVNILPERLRVALEHFGGRGESLAYLAHEYLIEHWRPVYFSDVARALAPAKLTHVACSELIKNFYNLAFTEEQRKVIAEIPLPELKETLKDFCADNSFRRDVFVRGARHLTEQRLSRLLAGLTLALIRPAPEEFEIGLPGESRWRPDPRVYSVIFKALGERPRSVAEMLSLAGLPREHQVGPVELVGLLVGANIAGLYQKPTPAQSACADRLNALLEAEPEIPLDRGAVIATPAARTGITLSAAAYALYRALRHGEAPDANELARQFIKRCRDGGTHPVVDGKAIPDAAEAERAVTRDYEIKIERTVPIWRALGMV